MRNKTDDSIFWILMVFMAFMCSLGNSQDTGNTIVQKPISTPVAKALLNLLKKQSIDFPEQVAVVRETIESKIYPTGDSLLIADANSFLEFLANKPMAISWRFNDDYKKLIDKKKYRMSTDKFTGYTHIYYKKLGYSYPVTLRLVENNGSLNLLMDIKLWTSDWVFADEVIFLINGETYDVGFQNAERRVLSGNSLVEEKTYVVDDYLLHIIQKIALSDEDTDIRFSGKRVQDGKLTKKVNPIFKEILDLVNVIGVRM